MEQKELIDKFYIRGSATLGQVLQALANLSSDGINQLLEHQIPLKGETNLYKLLNRSDPVTNKFLDQKVDLNKLKGYLEAQGLPFAFNHVEGGTNLYFRIKDEELAKKALENVFKDITENTAEATKKILRKPGSMTFEEKLQYYDSKAYKGTLEAAKQVQETISKGKVI